MTTERTDIYQSPFLGRYSSYEMQHLWSPDVKFSTWRKLWIALARAEHELGLPISVEQIAELEEHVYDINYDVAKEREKKVRHDVMSHVYAYGVQCPEAKGIIHLGATSCYVTDNTDILLIRDSLELVKKKLLGVIKLLADTANKHKEIPILGRTHFQPAALVTVGRREAMWLQNFMEDLEQLEFVKSTLKMLGCRGATGSQSTYVELFEGDMEKVKELEKLIVKQFDFNKVFPISGQTYPRNLDVRVLQCLQNIAVSAEKMAKDIRLLQGLKEMEEPFEKNQIGSSAMAYKRNPMRSERICSLARYVKTGEMNAVETASDQWLERTLDDSANRRISIPEAFMAVDGILKLCANVVDGLVVYEKVIEKHIREELPFMVTENIMMEAAKKGGDRQELHERIRVHSQRAGEQVKLYGEENDLIQRIVEDEEIGLTAEEIEAIMNPKELVGRCPQQVTDYLEEYVYPVLEANKDLLTIDKEVSV